MMKRTKKKMIMRTLTAKKVGYLPILTLILNSISRVQKNTQSEFCARTLNFLSFTREKRRIRSIPVVFSLLTSTVCSRVRLIASKLNWQIGSPPFCHQSLLSPSRFSPCPIPCNYRPFSQSSYLICILNWNSWELFTWESQSLGMGNQPGMETSTYRINISFRCKREVVHWKGYGDFSLNHLDILYVLGIREKRRRDIEMECGKLADSLSRLIR